MKIQNKEKIKNIIIESKYSAKCIYDQNIFNGIITIEYQPKENYVELIELGERLNKITSVLTSAEKICCDLHSLFLNELGIEAQVKVSAESSTHPRTIVEK